MDWYAAATTPGMLLYGAGLLAFLFAAIFVISVADRSVGWEPQPKCRALVFRRPDFLTMMAEPDRLLAAGSLLSVALMCWAMSLGIVPTSLGFVNASAVPF